MSSLQLSALSSQPSALNPQLSAPRRPPIIGFCGLAGHGKTAAAIIVGRHYGYCRLSFAAPLRAMLMALGLTAADLSTHKAVPHALLGGRTPREAMQSLGTDWGRRMIDSDLWLRAARHLAVMSLDADQRVAFDDVRFDNEAEMIRHLGGIVIQVVRPGAPQIAPAHASEAGVSPALVDHTVEATDLAALQTRLLAHLNG